MTEPFEANTEANTESFASNSHIAALILAGGESRRMGQDKALLSWNGRSLLRRTCDLALACTSEVAVITLWPERYQAVIPPAVRLLQEDNPAGTPQGPLLGFAQGLTQLNADWILLLACDLPGLEVQVVRQWQAQLDTVRTDAIATLPYSTKGWEPLCGFYHRRCQTSLNQAIHQGIRSFQRWLADQTVVPLSVAPDVLINCNTPVQWQSFLRSRGQNH